MECLQRASVVGKMRIMWAGPFSSTVHFHNGKNKIKQLSNFYYPLNIKIDLMKLYT